MPVHEELLQTLYRAFNARDIDVALAGMHPDVDWPNGMEGGRVIGHGEVRAYWTRQWGMIDPHVEPLAFAQEGAGRTVVTVHQLVRDRAGELLVDAVVEHAYLIEDGLIRSMEIRKP
jgi:SnoaL-like domain